jgi:hypothetical protein
MSQIQLDGFYIFGGVGLAMMANSAYIRLSEKQENERKNELLSGVTDQPVYSENMNRRYSIGGKKTKRNKIKR